MLQAYIDDSESNTADRRLVLAAYINTADKWIEFSEAWDEALRRAPSITDLHMVDAQNLKGQFRGWDPLVRTQKLISLAKVICASAPRSLDCSLSASLHRKAIGPKAPYGLSSPYFPATFVLVAGVARLCHALGETIPCDFIFDRQENVSRHVVNFWDYVVARQPHEWGRLINHSPIFRDKANDQSMVPLQAADMLAWHLRRFYEGTYPEEYEPIRDLLRPGYFNYSMPIPDSTLHHWANGFENIPGSEGVLARRDWDAAMERIMAEGGIG